MNSAQVLTTTRFEDDASHPDRRTGLELAKDRLSHDGLRDLSVLIRLAPVFGLDIARRPDLADALKPSDVSIVTDGVDGAASLVRLISEVSGFDAGMQVARRCHQALNLRHASRFVLGKATRAETAKAFSSLADASITAMAELAEMHVRRKFGPLDARWAVFGLGKLGGRDMTATSDVDLMIVYDADDLQSQTSMSRFAQALIQALGQRDENGRLYEVDMRLRPHGDKGAVAVQLSGLMSYYTDHAWTWEHMAMTRLRPVCGDATLCDEVMAARNESLAASAENPDLTEDVRNMRARVASHRSASSFWDMKLSDGGLMDIEFVTQHAMLLHAGTDVDVIRGNTRDALIGLMQAGVIDTEEALTLLRAEMVQAVLQQAQRATLHARADDVENADQAWKDWFCSVVDVTDLAACRSQITKLREQVVAIRERRLG